MPPPLRNPRRSATLLLARVYQPYCQTGTLTLCYRVRPEASAVYDENQPVAKDHFTWKRQRYEVIDRVVAGRKELLITRRLSSGPRQRFQAFDRVAGPHGALCILQIMPHTPESWQRIDSLQRLGRHNPELPQILEFYRKGNEIVSIEPWIEGKDLRSWIRKMRESPRQHLGAPEAIRLFRQLAHGLRHLHRHCGLVHADIKPANIILSNASRKLVLIDYGSAWGIERTTSRYSGDGISEVYAAPEILMKSVGVNFRADYFSLAAVCYEVLTLQTPYDGLGGRAGLPQFENQRDSLYLPPSQLSREKEKLDRPIWQAIDALLSHSLQLNPNNRPSGGPEWLATWDSAFETIRNPQTQTALDKVLIRLADWIQGRTS